MTEARPGAAAPALRPVLTLCLALAGAPVLAQPAAPPPTVAGGVIEARHMASHRATYRLTVQMPEGAAGLRAEGAMLVEVIDACDGWASRLRLTLSIVDTDGGRAENVMEYNSYESRDGVRFRFSVTDITGGAVTGRLQGAAEIGPQGGTVRYEHPAAREVALPGGTLLPMAHNIAVLNAARAGRHAFQGVIFDGTNADGASDAAIAVGPWIAPQPQDGFPALARLGSVRMRSTVSDRAGPVGAAGAPERLISQRIYENGVITELKSSGGGLVLSGRIAELTLLPSPC